MLYDQVKILRTVIVYISKKAGHFRKTKEMTGICQSRLSSLVLQINFDVDCDTRRVKNIFGKKHRVIAFAANCATVTLNFNLF